MTNHQGGIPGDDITDVEERINALARGFEEACKERDDALQQGKYASVNTNHPAVVTFSARDHSDIHTFDLYALQALNSRQPPNQPAPNPKPQTSNPKPQIPDPKP